jgi:tetratricopeptide (TPR) repeat protein
MSYVVAHRNTITYVAIALAVVVLAVVVWNRHVTAVEERAFTLLSKGIALYQEDAKGEDTLQAFSEVIETYPRTRAGRMALLYRGRVYLDRKAYDQAIADFEDAEKHSSAEFLTTLALNALGTTHMAKGDYEQAIEAFQRVLASDEEWITPFVFVRMGMCWEHVGNHEKAAEVYRRALEQPLPRPWESMVHYRLNVLGIPPE